MMSYYQTNEFAEFRIQGGILFYTYKPYTVINLYVAKTAIEDRIAFQRKKAYPIFYDVRGILDIDKAGRDYMSKEGFVLTKAIAFMVHSNSKALVQFYLGLHQQNVPTSFFTDQCKAIEFLKPYTF